jgi:hypothetical protein
MLNLWSAEPGTLDDVKLIARTIKPEFRLEIVREFPD